MKTKQLKILGDAVSKDNGCADWNKWREENPTEMVDLSGAHMAGWKLHRADLRKANLTNATMIGCNLIEANLQSATMVKTKICAANLGSANLQHADLNRVSANRANFENADCRGIKLDDRSSMLGVYLNAARFDEKIFTLLLHAIGVNKGNKPKRDKNGE